MSEFPDLDAIIPLKIFCGPQNRNKNKNHNEMCDHAGYLVKNGFNIVNGIDVQRFKCSKCGKRFGTEVTPYDLLNYQEVLKKILYELLFLGTNQRSVSVRYGIPQEMVSRFKKNCIQSIYSQNTDILESPENSLPGGIMLGDETFMGERGSSHTQINFINANYKMLASGPAIPDHLGDSISTTFMKIPETCRKRLRILFTDGEPSYKDIVSNAGGKVIHVVQYHNKKQLGQISIQKYEKVGPHKFHYVINTHWKIFNKGTHVLKFKWEIKLIKGHEFKRRGRPRLEELPERTDQKWRQRVEDFINGRIVKEGTGSVYINCLTKKVSRRAGGSDWMVRMIQALFPIFFERFVTTGLIESKHNQIKGKGTGRKQQDSEYNHQLYTISAFLADNGHLPSFLIDGRPLYKYIMKEHLERDLTYDLSTEKTRIIQSTLRI